MKYSVHFIVLAVLIALLVSPLSIWAQTTYEYREQSGDLRQKIDALTGVANSTLIMPVLFGVEVKDISPNFGDPRSGGRTHLGEDIMAVKGTPVISPTAAVVLRVGVGAGEGNYVHTANPGGETFIYMHLDRFGEGVASGLVLKAGSLIGYVGNTGNASLGSAHLHFEIHNSSRLPVDPFPRLTGEIPLREKISYLSVILSQSSDSATLSQFLVSNFYATFSAAIASNINLPLPIVNAYALASVASLPASTISNLPAGDLDIGSVGAAVIKLQKYLIQAGAGVAATRLESAGATGNFGPITKAALVEYQAVARINPASGYYGSATRAFIEAHPLQPLQSAILSNPTGTNAPVELTRDLYKNLSGEDVRILQRLLNANGFTVVLTGLDSTVSPRAGLEGFETTYFGPATEAAVISFQIARGITPSVGYVGPLTRAALTSY